MRTAAEIRISGVPERREEIRGRLTFALIERGDVVIRSLLDPDLPLNDHLLWFWMSLKHHRKYVKTLRQDGATIVCRCEVSREPVRLLPNAAEMLHLLGIELVVEMR